MRKYVIGAFIGAALMFSIQAGAATLKGSKVAGTADVQLDGKLIGTAAIINSSSYLPVRMLANQVGLDVDFEGGTVILTTPEETQDPGESTEQPTTTQQYSLDEINSKIQSLESTISVQQKLVDSFSGIDTPDAKAVREGFEELKSQLEVWKQRKAELESQQ